MTTHHFGTDINPAHYVEVADPANPGQVKRPAAGAILKVRDSATLTDLPDITTTTYGYWSYTTTDVPGILVSGDGGITWVGPLYSRESTDATHTVAADVAEATATADAARDAVAGLIAQGVGGDAYATMAPGSLIVWPPPNQAGQLLERPTSRIDVVVDWNLDTYPPEGNGYLIPGVDRWTDTSP